MRGLIIFLILILAVSAGYAQTPENMKLHVTIVDAEGKPIPAKVVDRCHILDLSDEPMYTLIVPHDGTVTVVPPTPDKARHDKMVGLVDRMLGMHKKLDAATLPNDKTQIQRQIAATDREIDNLVYELYGLTDEEIKIVEETS